MNQLSKEAKQLIEESANSFGNLRIRHGYKLGAEEALINPFLLETQGLISLEDAFLFFHWATTNAGGHYYDADLKLFVEPSTSYEETKTISEIFQIYKQQKP